MKKGFTLAELLIVLGITGITAAILLPTINNLMPDKTKIMYLKAYDELQRDIQSLASNSSLYPTCLEENNTSIGCSEHPLINTSKPLTKKFESYTGDTKLCKLLAFSMDTEESCKEESYTYNNSTFKNNLSFTTKNGMQWIVSPQTRTIESDKATYQSDIYVDVDPSKKSKNCLYDSVNCKEPDRFKFLVAADGSVIPADPMGLMYVNTRKSYMKNKKQKADGEVAALLTEELREFGYRPCSEGSGNGGSQGGDGYGDGGGSSEIPPGESPVLPGHRDCTGVSGNGIDSCVCGDTYEGRIINCINATGRAFLRDEERNFVIVQYPTFESVVADFPLNSNIKVYTTYRFPNTNLGPMGSVDVLEGQIGEQQFKLNATLHQTMLNKFIESYHRKYDDNSELFEREKDQMGWGAYPDGYSLSPTCDEKYIYVFFYPLSLSTGNQSGQSLSNGSFPPSYIYNYYCKVSN